MTLKPPVQGREGETELMGGEACGVPRHPRKLMAGGRAGTLQCVCFR